MISIKKLVIFFLISSMIISVLLIYKDYNSNFDLKGYYIVQSYFFIFIFVLSIIILFLSKTIQTYFLIILTSFIIFLYLYEGFIFYKGDIKLINNNEKETINNLIELQDEIRKKKYYTAYSVNDGTLNSFSGLSNSKTILCNEDNFWASYVSDRNGFNNPDYVWDENILDIVVLGDSMVQGACVNEGDDISSVIRKNSNFNVINLGWTSTGPLAQYSMYLEYIDKKPKYLVWVYDDSDLLNLKYEKEDELLNKYLFNSKYKQNLKAKRTKINLLIKKKHENFMNKKLAKPKISKYKNLQDYFKLYKIRQLYIYKLSGIIITNEISYNPDINHDLNLYFKIIDEMKTITKKNNTQIIFVYLPPKSISFSMKNRIIKKIKEKIFSKMKSENIEIIDIENLIKTQISNPGNLYPKQHIGMHFNKIGYEFIGMNILKFFFNKN